MDYGISKIFRPRESDNESEVCGYTRAGSIENASDGGSLDTSGVVFTVKQNYFFHIFHTLRVHGLIRLCCSFQEKFGKV